MTESQRNLPHVVSGDEWLAARQELLAKEKELTRQRDALNAEGRRLPMVRIEKEYVFEGPDGKASLLDLFEGRRQLIEAPGRSCLVREDESVFHTYSVYARGLETVGGSYYFLDETALGRQEDWEEPKGRASDARGAIPDFS